MTKFVVQPLRLSDNEVSLQNLAPLKILSRGLVYDVPAGHTIYLEDKAQYKINVVEDEVWAGTQISIAVNGTLPAADTENRVVLNFQDVIAKTRIDHAAAIDLQAEGIRGIFITLGSGQAMTYQQKLVEARLYVEDNDVADDLIPHIVAETEDEGITRLEKAQEIIQTAKAWTMISAEIDRRRLAAKRAVTAGTTLEEVDAALNVDWSGLIPDGE